ncbi:2',3'-cyclic-nucleotide 3'-phosphodiesterase [Hygrophoropsis aurantiaca]|uniref:2',3'-cyclic-nucleotide 3'-phosphodiesterase n=1 Tax=Hygrophoropsis aurantiaca TaxID=72124 RepID=A0ACB8A0P9_9AGAM|nr:2',3'-cyclic-nucleotide 3'-phosphodiesterase [Hygrophoropsis aurantiaca]
MGTALWLVPSAAQRALIESVLPTRSANTPLSANSYPKIIPHITLVSIPSDQVPTENPDTSTQNSVQKRLLHALSTPRPPPIRADFAALKTGDHYFRSVYIAVQRTPELVQLNEHVIRELGVREGPAFPHMSLCYITDDDDTRHNERANIARALYTSGTVIADAEDDERCSLVCPGVDGVGSVSLTGFDGEEVWIVRCDGPVDTWQVLETTHLAPSPP